MTTRKRIQVALFAVVVVASLSWANNRSATFEAAVVAQKAEGPKASARQPRRRSFRIGRGRNYANSLNEGGWAH